MRVSALVAAAAVALFGVPALAFPAVSERGLVVLERGITPRTNLNQAVSAKFFAHTTCSHKGGPVHDYPTGCTPIADDAHGMKITRIVSGCHVYKWQKMDCSGKSREVTSTECEDMGWDWNALWVECKITTSNKLAGAARKENGGDSYQPKGKGGGNP